LTARTYVAPPLPSLPDSLAAIIAATKRLPAGPSRLTFEERLDRIEKAIRLFERHIADNLRASKTAPRKVSP
jgi:hypothetical protein